MMKQTEGTLVILAGGKSSRMGRDKTFLPYKNTTFIEYLIRRAEQVFDRIVVAAGPKEHAEKIRQKIGSDNRTLIVADRLEGIGPMGGMLAVFEEISDECFVTVAVDIPEADMRVLRTLWQAAREPEQAKERKMPRQTENSEHPERTGHACAAVMASLDGSSVEPCAAAYNRIACEKMRSAVQRGEYSIRKAIGEERIRIIGPDSLILHNPGLTPEGLRSSFRNVNTVQELKALHKEFAAGDGISGPKQEADIRMPRGQAGKIPEILSPAGTEEALHAAVHAGCDAVYLGGTLFGARAYAGNFDQEALLRAIDYCHLFGVRVYMTVNTLLKESEIAQLPAYMEPFYLAGIDGIIVQDTGVIRLLREVYPDLPLHASTQMSISSACGAQLLKDLGLTRVVPARELTLKEIVQIREQTGVEVETFVHGAMCYAYSGKCLFSSFLGGRSGNRGRCAQPCRQLYEMADGTREYSMSMKDMCTLSILPKLIDAGIDSFKIEGRMKNPEYVAAATAACKKARDCYLSLLRKQQETVSREQQEPPARRQQDGIIEPAVCWETLPEASRSSYLSLAADLTDEMKDIYNRGGFYTGYYEPSCAKTPDSFRAEKGLEMISRSRPNHTGLFVGQVERVKGPDVFVRLTRKVQPRDVLEILPAEVELTSSGEGEEGQLLCLRGRQLQRIRPGMQVFRTRNHTLLQRIGQEICQKEKMISVRAVLSARIGKPLRITITAPGMPEVTVEGPAVEEASGRPASEAVIREKLKKTGGSHVEIDPSCEMDENAFIPMSHLNDLRRTAVESFKESVCSRYRRSPDGIRKAAEVREGEGNGSGTDSSRTFLRICTEEQLDTALRWGKMQVLLLDGALAETPRDLPGWTGETVLCLPEVARQSRLPLIQNMLRDLPKETGIMVRNLDELGMLRQMGYRGRIIGDASLYVSNTFAMQFYLDLFPQMQFLCSDELTDKEQEQIRSDKGRMIVKVYGHQPLMISNQCLNRNYTDCRKKGQWFRDSRRERFYVKSSCTQCFSIIYNGKCTYMGDRIREMGYQRILYDFIMEDPQQMLRILNGSVPQDYTRGHHYKGVE